MNKWLDDIGNPVGWILIGGGTVMSWVAAHGGFLFGASISLGGLWIQWMTYRLREREAERKVGLDAVLRPAPLVASQAQSLRDSVDALHTGPRDPEPTDAAAPKGPDYSS